MCYGRSHALITLCVRSSRFEYMRNREVRAYMITSPRCTVVLKDKRVHIHIEHSRPTMFIAFTQGANSCFEVVYVKISS